MSANRANIDWHLMNMIGGRSVPQDGEGGFAKGAIAVKTTGTVGLGSYFNEGDEDSCRFRSAGGMSPLITGASDQGPLDAPSATQSYAIGSRLEWDDGTVYRYAEAAGDCSPEMLAYSAHMYQALNWSAVVSGALAAKTMVVTVGGSDGDGSGNIAADYLKGGSILITNDATNGSVTMTIAGNTVVSGGGAMTVTLERGLPWLLTTSHKVEAIGSPYMQMQAKANCPADVSFQGRPTRKATSTLKYHWVQTWGRCWVTPNNGFSTVDVGNTVRNQQVVSWNGTIAPHDDDKAQTEYNQHIGYVCSRTQGGTTQGAPFIFLQIAP